MRNRVVRVMESRQFTGLVTKVSDWKFTLQIPSSVAINVLHWSYIGNQQKHVIHETRLNDLPSSRAIPRRYDTMGNRGVGKARFWTEVRGKCG